MIHIFLRLINPYILHLLLLLLLLFSSLLLLLLLTGMSGVIVEDCLMVANNMLRDCEVAQKFLAQARINRLYVCV